MVADAAASGKRVRIPPGVWGAPVRGEVKAVLLVLWRYVPYLRSGNEPLFVYPRVDTLAAQLHTTTRSVYRSIAKLIELGFLERATQTVTHHAQGHEDRTITIAGFVLFDEPIGRAEEVTGEQIEAAHQLELWSELGATDGSVTGLGRKCHSPSFSDLRSDLHDSVVSDAHAHAPTPARVAHDVPTTDDDDEEGQEGTTPPLPSNPGTRTTQSHAGTTTTSRDAVDATRRLPTGHTPSEGNLRHAGPTASPAPADPTSPPATRERTQGTTTSPSCGRPPPYLHRPLALWEFHEATRVAANVGGPHRSPPDRATLEGVVRLRDHIRRALDCDEDLAWRALDCYVRGAIRLVAEAVGDNRRVAPMLVAARSDGREWAPDRFDKTWPYIVGVEWKADQAARMVDAELARTEALLAERRSWETDPDRCTAEKMREIAGPFMNRWKIGVAAGSVSHELGREQGVAT